MRILFIIFKEIEITIVCSLFLSSNNESNFVEKKKKKKERSSFNDENEHSSNIELILTNL